MRDELLPKTPDTLDLVVYRFDPSLQTPILHLDPITVLIEPIRPGASRVIVQCYASAWTAYWGAHGKSKTVEQFMLGCDVDYIVGNLLWAPSPLMTKSNQKHQYRYVSRIVEAMLQHFREKGIES